MSEPVDFLTVPLEDGGSWTRLDRLTDGRVMCCLCFAYCTREELNPVDGGVEDVCKGCARVEAAVAEVPADRCRVPYGRDSERVRVCTLPYRHPTSWAHRDGRLDGGL